MISFFISPHNRSLESLPWSQQIRPHINTRVSLPSSFSSTLIGAHDQWPQVPREYVSFLIPFQSIIACSPTWSCHMQPDTQFVCIYATSGVESIHCHCTLDMQTLDADLDWHAVWIWIFLKCRVLSSVQYRDDGQLQSEDLDFSFCFSEVILQELVLLLIIVGFICHRVHELNAEAFMWYNLSQAVEVCAFSTKVPAFKPHSLSKRVQGVQLMCDFNSGSPRIRGIIFAHWEKYATHVPGAGSSSSSSGWPT